ncbi:MAG: alpha/beta fold hydrolase [Parcubacteria group bacterium]
MLASRVSAYTAVTGEITSATTWTKENSPYRVGGNVAVKAPLTVEAGTIVKFLRGSNDGLKIQSDFHVNGTKEEPVVFTSIRDDESGGDTNGDGARTKPATGDWLSLSFISSKDFEIKIKYAKIFYANYGVSLSPSSKQTEEISIKYSEIKKNGIGITIGNAEALIEKNVISENANEGISVNASTKKAKAINNSIANNGVGANGQNSTNPEKIALEAEYNWWGNEKGPYNEENNPDGEGNFVAGMVSYTPWLKEDPITFPDPVIVIPGIMGSWKKGEKWEIDPIFHTYDNLLEEFINEGYEPETRLFTFPYEWRDSNKVNAVELRAKIQKIKNKTGRPKVDIVAHSMGGLLAREYIESSYYEDDVDQLITVGTPHLGGAKGLRDMGSRGVFGILEIFF